MVWEAVRFVSFSRSDARLSKGIRRTRGPRLDNAHELVILNPREESLNRPFQRLVLDITVLVVQGLQ